jgi:GT2 family glycosyltransferase
MRHRGHGTSLRGMAGAAPREPFLVDGVSGCVMMVRREVFDAVGLLDEDYFFSFEDLEFCLRARAAGFATVIAPDTIVYHEGGRSLGADSPRRFYFAARNHLLMARQTGASDGSIRALCRAGSIVALNLGHAILSPGGSVAARVAAVLSGTLDYVAGRFGDTS